MGVTRTTRTVATTTALLIVSGVWATSLAHAGPRRPYRKGTEVKLERRRPSPSPSPSSAASARADGPWSATLTWSAPPGATRVEIARDGSLRDRVPAGNTSFTDRMLWPNTTYTYTLTFRDDSGKTLASAAVKVTTLAGTGHSFPRLYSSDSFFNQPIPPGAEVDPNSAAMIAKAIVPYASGANFANTDKWGVGLAFADAGSTTYSISCLLYGCSRAVSARVPLYARPALGSDAHLAVIDPASGIELDMYKASYDAAADAWSAGSRYLTDPAGWGALCSPGSRCGGAVASSLALMGGVVRPEEIAQGRIDHALVFTTPYTRKDLIACPAAWTDGVYDDPAALPEGARIQLDPSFDIDAQSWPRWKKVIARALQEYGAYLVDTGGSLAVRGEAVHGRGYDAWSLAGTPKGGSLADLPWERFRVLKITPC